MGKKLLIQFMCSFLWIGGYTMATAALLIDSGTGTNGGPTIESTQFLAKQFTLPFGAVITEIAPFLFRIGTGPDPVVKVQVTDAIGPGTPISALLFETSITVSNDFNNPTFLPIPTSFFLEAGTYFLVLTSNADISDSAVWGDGAPTEIGPEFRAAAFNAIFNSAFPPASEFTNCCDDNLGLRISGIPAILGDIFNNSVSVNVINRRFSNDTITANFTPNLGLTINQAKDITGYNHFNWINIVTKDNILNYPLLANIAGIKDQNGNLPSVPYFDPVAGGYEYQAD